MDIDYLIGDIVKIPGYKMPTFDDIVFPVCAAVKHLRINPDLGPQHETTWLSAFGIPYDAIVGFDREYYLRVEEMEEEEEYRAAVEAEAIAAAKAKAKAEDRSIAEAEAQAKAQVKAEMEAEAARKARD